VGKSKKNSEPSVDTEDEPQKKKKDEEDYRDPEERLQETLGFAPEIIREARFYRNNMSSEEKRLWKLMGEYENPWGFLRQWPLGGYFLDFYSSHYNVALEMDGPFHAGREVEDHHRDKILKEKHAVDTIRITPWQLTKSSAAQIYAYLSDAIEFGDGDED
jgi:very-short-patch-repair endonuclease